MREFCAEKFIERHYQDVALKYYPEIGEEALGRCKQSLINGKGLCMGEWLFLRNLRKLSRTHDRTAMEFDEFMEDAKAHSIRTQITEEETDYWINVLTDKSKRVNVVPN